MRSFSEIEDIARDRHGAALEDRIGNGPASPAELAKVPEDRWLAQFTKSVFQAGFNWKVIEAKWDGFEEAFRGFDVDACAFMAEDWFEDLTTDTRIVRNPIKIRTVQANAQMIADMREKGGAGVVIGGWPSEDFVGLLAHLKAHGSHLGAASGQYALRFLRRDGFILSRDVVARLVAEGVVDKAPTSKKAMAAVQAAFNAWRDQSGASLVRISRVLALSV
ncbi:DNA-3-methyladenine glycosylase I [Pseudaestuariivita atlantica]|uniref:3-methyladenine DNA glycosylase n=1 Tax=Pseudaestuariivita atlantica TaxID=1317121 RepID=A0A0L1JMV8_9RHOB|nr:DNA-3-methyladenine glycosylase I [Pseudaestuariivita atlantica]KNG92748.1 3-methyladenine DNA glycosylase [Pseudaestuariivita atlantica]